MKIIIALHSTTGNTRLIARHARDRLRAMGHHCELFDITRGAEGPDLDDVDLLGLACPTMYFRPTLVMERFVARLPNADRPRPAFLLATASGIPGAHFAILAEQLTHKGYVTLGAHFEPFPDNWPIHRAAVSRLEWAQPAAEVVARRLKGSREVLALFFPMVGDAGAGAPGRVSTFADEMVEAARRLLAEEQVRRPRPLELAGKGTKLFQLLGRVIAPEALARASRIGIDQQRCSRCGTCIEVCPVGCLSAEAEGLPKVGSGCTGCWACFNRCPDRAISGLAAGVDVPRYRGPSQRARELFRRPR